MPIIQCLIYEKCVLTEALSWPRVGVRIINPKMHMVLIQPFAGPLVPRGTPNGLTHTQITSHGSEFRALFARNLFFCLYGLLEVGEAPSSSQSKSILPLALNMDMWKICSYIFQVCIYIYIYMCVCVLCIWICIYIYVYNVYVYIHRIMPHYGDISHHIQESKHI